MHRTMFAYTEPGFLYPAFVNISTPEDADAPDAGTVTITLRGQHLPGSDAVPGQAAVPARPVKLAEDGISVLDPGAPAYPAIPAVPAVPPAPGVVVQTTVSMAEFYTGVLAAVAAIEPGGTFSHASGLSMTRSMDGLTLTFALGAAAVRVPLDIAKHHGEALRDRAVAAQAILEAASNMVPITQEVVERVEAKAKRRTSEARQREAAKARGAEGVPADV